MWIVHLVFSFTGTEADSLLLDMMSEQIKSNKVLFIVVNSDVDPAVLSKVPKEVKVLTLNRRQGSRGLQAMLSVLYLNLVLSWRKTFVLHCHNLKIIKLLLFKRLRKKAVLTFRSVGLTRELITAYHSCYAVSKSLAAEIADDLGKVKWVYNGVNAKRIPSKIGRHLPSMEFKIVQLGSLDHQIKAQDLLLEVIKELKDEGMGQFKVDFWGDGPSREYLEDLTISLGIEEHVRFCGVPDMEEICQQLNKYDLLIHPSSWDEFGLPIVEGMFAEVPVLVTDNESAMEIIGHGDYGYYFKGRNMADLKTKLLWIAQNYHTSAFKYKILQAAAYARNCFDVRRTVQYYQDRYKMI